MSTKKINGVYITTPKQQSDPGGGVPEAPKDGRTYGRKNGDWNPILFSQVETMPTADASYLDKIVQFVGETTASYTNGYFYKCVLNGDAYTWGRVNVQPRSSEPVSGHPYISLERLHPYLYRVTFDSIPQDNGNNAPVGGGCSAFVANGKLLRNYDFNYDYAASCIVRTKGFEGMAMITGLNDGQMDDDLIAQLPYRMVDGRNNNGIKMSVHLLFNDWEYTGAGQKSIPMTSLPYEILSRVKSMATISTDLADVLGNLNVTEAMGGYLLQCLVTDGTTTYAVIPPTSDNQSYELVDATSYPKMSNFRYVARAEVSRYDMDIQTRPTGIERFNMMPCELSDLRFTKAYEEADRLSEFIGIDDTTKASTDEELTAIYNLARAEYLARERDGKTWQTMHSVVYGNRMERLYIQENWDDNCIPEVLFAGEGISISGGVIGVDFNLVATNSHAAELANAVATQKAVLPTASADNLGKIYQYTGETDEDYTNGYYYKCVSDGGDPASYSWEQTDVQPGSSNIPASHVFFTDEEDAETKVTALESNVGELANPTVASSVPTGGMLPETLYELGTLTGTISLPHAAGVTGKRNHYFYTFETGATAPTITWDSSITKWYCPFNVAQSGAVTDAPILSANKHYEVSVIAGNAAVMEV